MVANRRAQGSGIVDGIESAVEMTTEFTGNSVVGVRSVRCVERVDRVANSATIVPSMKLAASATKITKCRFTRDMVILPCAQVLHRILAITLFNRASILPDLAPSVGRHRSQVCREFLAGVNAGLGLWEKTPTRMAQIRLDPQ